MLPFYTNLLRVVYCHYVPAQDSLILTRVDWDEKKMHGNLTPDPIIIIIITFTNTTTTTVPLPRLLFVLGAVRNTYC